jgi:DNA-binding MarR family transcriptional regulator
MTIHSNVDALCDTVAFLNKQGNRMSLTKVQVFLLVAENNACTTQFIVKQTARNQSSISRVLDTLGAGKGRYKSAALGWVATAPDPEDTRRDKHVLTREGLRIVKELEGLMPKAA